MSDMALESCVFCDILRGDAPANWVARDEHASAFFTLPDSALAPGHTLVVTNSHVVGVQDAGESDLAAAMSLAGRVSRAMQSSLGATGVNILNASGPGSEQSVHHLHLHVVPRWQGDGLSTWPVGRSSKTVAVDPLQALAEAML